MITKKDLSYFRIAKQTAKLSTWEQVRYQIGCVVVLNHRIISVGFNTTKTDTLQKKYNKERFTEESCHMAHAELLALKPLLYDNTIDTSKLKVYVYRELKTGKLGCARPCKSCMKLIKDIGIRYIYYTTSDGYAEEKILY